ncbi:hypothetical protein AVEN_88310-1, partial [Araneus ventricosus]
AETGLVYVKIHCPWEVLSRYGEILKFKMPMKESLFELPKRTSDNVPDFDFSKYYFRNLFNRMTGLDQSVSDLMHPECYKIRFKDCHFSTVYSRDKEYFRAIALHYIKRDWPRRASFKPEKMNVEHPPLSEPHKIIIPLLHIKLGLVKNLVKAMDKN